MTRPALTAAAAHALPGPVAWGAVYDHAQGQLDDIAEDYPGLTDIDDAEDAADVAFFRAVQARLPELRAALTLDHQHALAAASQLVGMGDAFFVAALSDDKPNVMWPYDVREAVDAMRRALRA